jgi:hypothetical protein
VTRALRPLLLIALATVASVAVLACSRSHRARTVRAAAAAAPLIRTEREVYRAAVTPTAVELMVVATFINRTRDTLFIHPCQQQPPFPPKVHLEKRVGGTWRLAWGPVCFHVLMLEPPRLAPGQSRMDTVRIWGSLKPNEYPDFAAGPVGGTYRLVYDWVYRSWDPNRRPGLGELLIDAALVSNEFRVVVE